MQVSCGRYDAVYLIVNHSAVHILMKLAESSVSYDNDE